MATLYVYDADTLEHFYAEAIRAGLIDPEDALEQDRTLSLEEAGLEEDHFSTPNHGFESVHDYIAWHTDGEDARYEMN